MKYRVAWLNETTKTMRGGNWHDRLADAVDDCKRMVKIGVRDIYYLVRDSDGMALAQYRKDAH